MNTFDLNKREMAVLTKLNTPARIQDFLDTLAMNFEEDGETCMSPRKVLRTKKCHCMEGAMLATAALRLHGHKPLIVDMKGREDDWDHALAVFNIDGKWGAITKTNHAVLRYREPVYKNIRELVMSYFHEYTSDDRKGNKTLRSYSMPVDMSIFDDRNWIIDENDLWYIDHYLDRVKHYPVLTAKQIKNLRKADAIEIAMGKLVEWTPPERMKRKR